MKEISKEVYEYVKAQVLQEEREKRRKAERRTPAAKIIFEALEEKYLPLLLLKYRSESDAVKRAKSVMANAEETALQSVGERSCLLACRHGKAKTVKKIAETLLEELLKNE